MTAAPAKAGRAKYDIGDLVRDHRDELELRYPLTRRQKRVLTDMEQCRTPALGGHVDSCPDCGFEQPSYNSCRNRHCPKCQALAQEKWIARRSERLLNVGHFHVVFTLPSQLRFLAQLAPREVFDALFHAAAATLLELGESRLRALLGATLVLHTWTRKLTFHPHVHAIVTAGGLALDGSRFCHSGRRYLFPAKQVMSPVFRGKFLALLGAAYAAGAFAHVKTFRDPTPSLVSSPRSRSSPGTSTRRRRSAAPSTSSTILVATPIASASPTAACSRSPPRASSSAPGATTPRPSPRSSSSGASCSTSCPRASTRSATSASMAPPPRPSGARRWKKPWRPTRKAWPSAGTSDALRPPSNGAAARVAGVTVPGCPGNHSASPPAGQAADETKAR